MKGNAAPRKDYVKSKLGQSSIVFYYCACYKYKMVEFRI